MGPTVADAADAAAPCSANAVVDAGDAAGDVGVDGGGTRLTGDGDTIDSVRGPGRRKV